MSRHFRLPGMLGTRLGELGFHLPSILIRSGLPSDLFQQMRVLVSTEEFFALWRTIASAAKDPMTGIKLGTETRLERFHPMGLAALSTASFGAAMQHLSKYKRLTAPEEIHSAIEGDEWHIWFRWPHANEVEPTILVEYCFAWTLTIGRQGTGSKVSPLRVELMERRENTRALERHFGCPVMSGCSLNVIVFQAADAALPFITQNHELLDMLTPQFDSELQAKIEPEPSLLKLVRTTIQHRLTGHRPSIDDVAEDLHLSSRTLQRKLREEGTSYQAMLDQARQHMARYYLRNSELALAETAYLLGFESANAFSRAFHSWEGVTPAHWRASLIKLVS